MDWVNEGRMFLKFKSTVEGSPGLFLDRDGVINYDTGYVSNITSFIIKKHVIAQLIKYSKDFNVFIVTNQSGISRGYFDWKEYMNLTAWYLQQLSGMGLSVCGVATSGELPGSELTSGSWRKPAIGMFKYLESRFQLDLERSVMVGDKTTDFISAKNSGVGSIYGIYTKGKNVECLYRVKEWKRGLSLEGKRDV